MTILVGIDDTDVLGARGTNKLARALAARVAPRWRCRRILRHQLLVDPRIPYTSHNGSASLAFEPLAAPDAEALRVEIREGMLADFIEGSDPGLCVATHIAPDLISFAERCRREVVTSDEARAVAQRCDVKLEGLGGTEGGVIGALAAVGLAATEDHGRVVFDASWGDDPTGFSMDVEAVYARGVDSVVDVATRAEVRTGAVALSKRLRPNRRRGRTVLFVEAVGPGRWRDVRAD